jgi:hypothetical protein
VQPAAAAVAELQRVVRGRSFDEEPMPELNSEAIDFRVASECFAPIRKLARHELHSLQLTTQHQGREVATIRRRVVVWRGLFETLSRSLSARRLFQRRRQELDY